MSRFVRSIGSLAAIVMIACTGSEPAQPAPAVADASASEPAEPATANTPAPVPEPQPVEAEPPKPVDEPPAPEAKPPPAPILEGTELAVNAITYVDIDVPLQRVEDPHRTYPRKLVELDRGILFESYRMLSSLDQNGVPAKLEHPELGVDGEFIEIVGSWPSDAWSFERQRKGTPKIRIMRLVDGVRPEPITVHGEEWLVTGSQEIRKSTGGGMLVRRKITGASQTFERFGAPGGSVELPKFAGKVVELLEIPRGEMHALVLIDDARHAIDTGHGRLLLPETEGRWKVKDISSWAPDHLAVLALDWRVGYLLRHDASGWSADFADDLRSLDWVYVAADGTTWLSGAELEGEFSTGPDNERHTWVFRRTPDGSWGRVIVPTRIYITTALSEDGTELWIVTDDRIFKLSALTSG